MVPTCLNITPFISSVCVRVCVSERALINWSYPLNPGNTRVLDQATNCHNPPLFVSTARPDLTRTRVSARACVCVASTLSAALGARRLFLRPRLDSSKEGER